MSGPIVHAVGQVVTASEINTWFIGQLAVKSADTGRASNTTPSADPDLAISVAANAFYAFDLRVIYKGGTNGASDMQFSVTGPSGMGGFYEVIRNQISGLTFNNVIVNSFPTVVNVGTNGTGNPGGLICTGSLTTGANAGTVAFNWAQNSSSGTATTVMASSYIAARRLA